MPATAIVFQCPRCEAVDKNAPVDSHWLTHSLSGSVIPSAATNIPDHWHRRRRRRQRLPELLVTSGTGGGGGGRCRQI